MPAPDSGEAEEQDDTLLLFFMCCHPSLTRPSAIALTLRAVGGLTTAEIARAFLVPEATMAQRISRAKKQIKSSGIGITMPTEAERTVRLDAVLHVLYLIFSEGYVTSGGPSLQRRDLANEAIRLGRMLHRTLPDDAEVAGLLALMLLTDARRHARTDADGELIPLDRQDRTLWDRQPSAKARRCSRAPCHAAPSVRTSSRPRLPRCTTKPPRAGDTDWPQILALYGLLLRVSDNPIVRLNHAVATAMVQGPQAGLELLERLADGRSHGRQSPRGCGPGAPVREGRRCRTWPSSTIWPRPRRTTSIPERNYLRAQAARLTAAIKWPVQTKSSRRPPMSSPATVANQKQILANQKKILANQKRIEANQKKLDTLLTNQKSGFLAKLK